MLVRRPAAGALAAQALGSSWLRVASTHGQGRVGKARAYGEARGLRWQGLASTVALCLLGFIEELASNPSPPHGQQAQRGSFLF